jgi:hypothetical protein
MNEAYHIKNDGTAIPVKVHVYAQADLMRAIAFLLKYDEEDKEKIENIFTQFVISLWLEHGSLRVEDVFNLQEKTREYRESYVEEIISVLFRRLQPTLMLRSTMGSLEDGIDYIQATTEINEILDQVFLRARYGGYYVTGCGADSREMVFRISSHGFDWGDIIWRFVFDHQRFIDSITVVRDTGGTGRGKVYGQYEQFPVDEFITDKKKILSSAQYQYKELLSGTRLYQINANIAILSAMRDNDAKSTARLLARAVSSPRDKN